MAPFGRRRRTVLVGVGVVVFGVAMVALVSERTGHPAVVRAGDEKTVMARLTSVLPGLDPGVEPVSSTYVCDDDASQPCHAVSRSWSVEGRRLTLDSLAIELADLGSDQSPDAEPG